MWDCLVMRESLIDTIERALKDRGWSARQASLAAGGSQDLVSNIRRGRIPSAERVEALCEVLGLEFYVGAHRSETATFDAHQLAVAIEELEREDGPASIAALSPLERARLLIAAYELVGTRHAQPRRALLRDLIQLVRRTAASGDAGPASTSR